MTLFTRIRSQRRQAYSKKHIVRAHARHEIVALCWHALSVEDAQIVGDDYRGELCAVCEKMNKNK